MDRRFVELGARIRDALDRLRRDGADHAMSDSRKTRITAFSRRVPRGPTR